MVAITRVEPELLMDRLDGRYNNPSAVHIRRIIAKSGLPTKRVGDILDLVCGPFGSALTADEHEANGEVLLVQPTNISEDHFSEITSWRISKHLLVRKGLKTYGPGTLLFARVGVYPHTGVLPDSAGLATISSSMIAGVPLDSTDPRYLAAFFKCRLGFALLLAAQKVTAQPTIGTTEIGITQVPVPSPLVQKYIGHKVRLAEMLASASKRTRRKAMEEIELVFRGSRKPAADSYSFIQSGEFSPSRIEAEFYGNVQLWAEKEIVQSRYPHKPLRQLASRIKDGPGGWGVSTSDYVEDGVPVIRTVNLIDGECDLGDCVYISEKKHKELAGHSVRKGSVLLSVRGTIGRSAIFSDERYAEASLNAAVVTIDYSDEILPGYLVEFLNSDVGRIQSSRMANGAVQKNMNLQETGSNLVVVAPMNIQERISDLHFSYIAQARYSRHLLRAAEGLVEGLIESKIFEPTLTAAQQALDSGDDSLDRALLSRLRVDGIDGQGEPVFRDLDLLYDLLDRARQELEA